jgi:hypothetical protein
MPNGYSAAGNSSQDFGKVGRRQGQLTASHQKTTGQIHDFGPMSQGIHLSPVRVSGCRRPRRRLVPQKPTSGLAQICRGEQPIIRLNAVLKALSESYPNIGATRAMESSDVASLSAAISIRQRVR